MTDTISDEVKEYRKWLIAAEQKSQEDFDKTVISLSSAALGISFAFIKDIVGLVKHQSPLDLTLVTYAWLAWGASVSCVLLSYYFSVLALRKTISQVDAEKIFNESPGGKYARIIAFLNPIGGILFLLGVIFMGLFVKSNL